MKNLTYIISFLFLILFSGCEAEEPRCNDGLKNGDEVEIDCGGSCDECYTCFDDIFNNNETNTDCGGPCAPCQNEWSRTNLPEGLKTIKAFHFANDQFGLIGTYDQIYKTANAGESWQEVILPEAWTGCRILYAISETDWYIQTDGQLFSTKNGGQNWETTYIRLLAIDFFDENNGIIILSNNDKVVYTTNDGGDNWTPKTYNNSITQDIRKVVQAAPNVHFLISRYDVYKGRHWGNSITRNARPTRDVEDEKYINFMNENDGFTLRYPDNGFSQLDLWKTTDAGANWFLDEEGLDQLNTGSLAFLDFTSIDDGFLVYHETRTINDRSTIGSYINNEDIWNPFGLINEYTANYISDCQIVDNHCFCIGSGLFQFDLDNL